MSMSLDHFHNPRLSLVSSSVPTKILWITVVNILILIFWEVRDVNGVIASSSLYGTSDLSRYYHAYNNILLDDVLSLGFTGDSGYYWVTFLANRIGLGFEFFLYGVMFFYVIVFVSFFYGITFCRSWLVYVVVMLLLFFLLIPLVTVVLRQGIATLFLVFFLFRKEGLSILYKIVVVFLAATFHYSAIMFLFYVLVEQYLMARIKLVDGLFIVVFTLYLLGLFSMLGNMLIDYWLNIGALGNTDSAYTVGFSIYKAIAIAIPAFLFRITRFSSSSLGKRLYIYFFYASTLGMLLSGLPYHDRVMLYAWAVSPILLGCFVVTSLAWLTRISKDSSAGSLHAFQ